MGNLQVVLSNGETVVIRPFCSRKIYKEIQKRTWANNPEIATKMENMKFNILDLAEAEDYGIFAMIEKILDKNGVVKILEESYVENLSMSDFEVLKEFVNKVINPTGTKTEEEKKD